MKRGWNSRLPGTLFEHFSRYVAANDGQCWEWRGPKDKNGYGKICHGGKHMRGHRVSYELHKGPIPPDKMVCHTCDNPSCVNPAHLFIGDSSSNMIDMVQKNRGPLQKLGPADIVEIRHLLKGGLPPKEIAPIFGVHVYTIRRIRNGRRWGHVEAA